MGRERPLPHKESYKKLAIYKNLFNHHRSFSGPGLSASLKLSISKTQRLESGLRFRCMESGLQHVDSGSDFCGFLDY
ncbi:hypothetical protein CJ030_MR7G008065 [Morella rubra]|uniref:Uncharacterized protein n=1 Tax=Morella rubra TaxID=262757 RepID=A0A6A1V522_9ROSI|nr:hypothetical protein CJ030_MR7G008065 [Morella rubra]